MVSWNTVRLSGVFKANPSSVEWNQDFWLSKSSQLSVSPLPLTLKFSLYQFLKIKRYLSTMEDGHFQFSTTNYLNSVFCQGHNTIDSQHMNILHILYSFYRCWKPPIITHTVSEFHLVFGGTHTPWCCIMVSFLIKFLFIATESEL